ncbi:MAG: alpha/beta hydrolase [Betaproteobacteria bacterium]|nr:alpha/beta hydrolase [Betaproteobacteria bacterium]
MSFLSRLSSKVSRWFGGSSAQERPGAPQGAAPLSISSSETQPRRRHVVCAHLGGLHRMAYYEWGEPGNPRVLLCVHGLTRNAHDFDVLARALSNEYRVVCPDIIGRGASDWMENPNDYSFPQYVSDMITLCARIDAETLDWVGTSMGGLIGMMIAGDELSPISRLVLNDVGPFVSAEVLQQMSQYFFREWRFASYAEAQAHLRKVHASFGPLNDAEWGYLARNSIRQAADGSWEFDYDPKIGKAFQIMTLTPLPLDLWLLYDRIRCPTLAIRGATSGLLPRSTHREMGKRGPCAKLAQIPDVGHAPTFFRPPEIRILREFLAGE